MGIAENMHKHSRLDGLDRHAHHSFMRHLASAKCLHSKMLTLGRTVGGWLVTGLGAYWGTGSLGMVIIDFVWLKGFLETW